MNRGRIHKSVSERKRSDTCMKTLKTRGRLSILTTGLIVLLGGYPGQAYALSTSGPTTEPQSKIRGDTQPAVERLEIQTRGRIIAQRIWDFDAYRQHREREIEAARRARAAKRQAERKLREEQRRKARAQVLERERQYREEHIKGIPGLQEHRRRYARELERRRQAAERRRLERWQQDDAKVVAE